MDVSKLLFAASNAMAGASIVNYMTIHNTFAILAMSVLIVINTYAIARK